MSRQPNSTEARCSKAEDVWFLLHKVEQLMINDPDYDTSLHEMITQCMDFVEDLQVNLGEDSSDWQDGCDSIASHCESYPYN